MKNEQHIYTAPVVPEALAVCYERTDELHIGSTSFATEVPPLLGEKGPLLHGAPSKGAGSPEESGGKTAHPRTAEEKRLGSGRNGENSSAVPERPRSPCTHPATC